LRLCGLQPLLRVIELGFADYTSRQKPLLAFEVIARLGQLALRG
jgi:hypothetical protein